jgi:hypothetical protein
MRLEMVRAASGRKVPEEALRGKGGVPARPNLVSPLLQPVQPVLLKQLPALVPLLYMYGAGDWLPDRILAVVYDRHAGCFKLCSCRRQHINNVV